MPSMEKENVEYARQTKPTPRREAITHHTTTSQEKENVHDMSQTTPTPRRKANTHKTTESLDRPLTLPRHPKKSITPSVLSRCLLLSP